MPDPAWYHRELQDQSFADWTEAYKFYLQKRKEAGEKPLGPDDFKRWVGTAHPGYKPPASESAAAPPEPYVMDFGPLSPAAAGPKYDSYEAFKKDDEAARLYAQVYQQAMDALKHEVGERRKELQSIANTAKQQIAAIHAYWAPKLQGYSQSLGRGGGSDEGRMGRLQAAAEQYLGQNVGATEREIALAESSGLSQLQQESELQQLGLYRDQLKAQAEGADFPSPDGYELKGVIEKLQSVTRPDGKPLSAEEVKLNAIAFAQAKYGVSEEEAWGRVEAALGEQKNQVRGPSEAYTFAQKVLKDQLDNRLRQPGGFKMSKNWFVGLLKSQFEAMGFESPSFYGIDQKWIDSRFADAYEKGKAEYARLWGPLTTEEPKEEGESFWSRLNPFD